MQAARAPRGRRQGRCSDGPIRIELARGLGGWSAGPRCTQNSTLSSEVDWREFMRSKQCLTASDVKRILAACEAEAAKNKWAVAIAIVDDGGFLLGFSRMDGAPVISAEVSVGKARTSAMTKRPSKFFEDRVKERPAFR